MADDNAPPTPEKKRKATTINAVFPTAIVRKILQFVPLSKHDYVVPFLNDEIIPEPPTQVPTALSARIGGISIEYAAMIKDIGIHSYETVRSVGLDETTGDALEEFYEDIAWRGEKIQCLSLEVGAWSYRRRGFSLYEGIGSVEAFDAMAIDWTRVFASCANIRRLDLGCIPLESTQLIKILDVASQQCKHLEAVSLPTLDQDGAELLPLMEMLHTAVKRWYEAGTCGGLRQLCVPHRIQTSIENGPSFVDLNDAFMRVVAQYCPKIEYFDGYRMSFQDDELMWCEEFICCSPEVWDQFCKSCTNLRELNWFAFPYLDPFFESFGKYTKPQLTKLILAGGEHHNYRTNEAGFYENKLSYSAAGIASLFAACPALKHLEILYMNEIEDGRRQLAMTDDVLVAIATHCSQLESFVIRELVRGQQIEPMALVTDVGVTGLAKIPTLRHVRMKSTKCGAPGVFALIEHAPQRGCTRVATVEIDKLTWDDNIPVTSGQDPRYESFLQLLELMVANPDKLAGRFFDVTMANHTYYRETVETPHVFSGKCVALLAKLAVVCPDVVVEVNHDGTIVDLATFEGDLTKLWSLRFLSPRRGARLTSDDYDYLEW